MSAPGPDDGRLLVSALAQAEMRQQTLQWALATATAGENRDSILARAQAYLEFITYPLRRDVARATVERQGQALN